MTFQPLLEGILDVKDPRGSEDRKFWKAWRRQYISFTVLYPPGRRDPYLQLKISHISSETPDKEVNLARDGVRLFRCRSKSRPYRTWAITSGSKIVLYFAAESEVQAQTWMQAVRNGLWPPCFSFQMLTACSYEVSLIDDDNTFLAGHLGVYGRFALTSENVISLMHPHWGSTLLQISLDNIADVLFIREAEVSPAGVFSIMLKRIEGTNVKALQFFCHTANDAIQWILSKVYTRRKSFSIKEVNGTRVSNSFLPNDNILANTESKKLSISYINKSASIQKIDVQNKLANAEFECINLQVSKMNDLKTMNDSINGDNLQNADVSIIDENEFENRQPDIKSNDSTYANISCGRDFTANLSYNSYVADARKDLNNEYANIKYLVEESCLITEISPAKLHNETTSESAVYATVNKSNTSKSLHSKVSKKQFSINHHLTNGENISVQNFTEANITNGAAFFKSEEICQNGKENYTSDKFWHTSDVDIKIDHKMKVSKDDSTAKHNSTVSVSCDMDDPLYSTVNKCTLSDSSKQSQNAQFPTLNDYKMHNSRLLPNLPNDFLDTSLNFQNLRNTATSGSSSSEEDTENLLWLIDELNTFDVGDHVYADVVDRKGTLYEDIDTSDDEYKMRLPSPPELPKRPQSLEIPDSLRLQKLSKNIKQTLEVMEDTQLPIKEYIRPTLIKKIKDVNRIMKISPNQEYSKEPFTVESKLLLHPKSVLVTMPNGENHL